MPSSITLTVHNLAQSTTFFLSALQPLDYKWRGEAGNAVGFGSASDKSRPADFWLTQEIPGVPASAAHVAFPATSHREVQDFFIAALKAGGKIHGEPATRDSSGYYSAAVIDFDGNSIEAVYRPSYSDDKENVASKSLVPTRANSTVSRATAARSVVVAPSVAPSKAITTKSFRDRDRGRSIDGDVLDNIFEEVRSMADTARKAINTFRPTPSTMNSEPSVRTSSKGNMPTKEGGNITGTLLGVAAGAALAYAFSSGNNKNEESESRRPTQTRSKTMPFERSTSVYNGSRRSSLPTGRIYEMDEVEYASRPGARGRRSSVSGIPTNDRHRSSSRRSSTGSRSNCHFEPIRMIEYPSSQPPSTTISTSRRRPSSRSHSYAGSEASVSTIKPSATTSSRPRNPGPVYSSDKSNRSRTSNYPPSAFPANSPSGASSSSFRNYPPLPPSSRPTTVYTRDHSRPRSTSYHGSRRASSSTAYENVTDDELRPEDSISQINSGGAGGNGSGRNRSRRRRA